MSEEGRYSKSFGSESSCANIDIEMDCAALVLLSTIISFLSKYGMHSDDKSLIDISKFASRLNRACPQYLRSTSHVISCSADRYQIADFSSFRVQTRSHLITKTQQSWRSYWSPRSKVLLLYNSSLNQLGANVQRSAQFIHTAK